MSEASKQTRYIVHFTGRGFTAPDERNPNGVRVVGRGQIIVDGLRPSRSFDIPFEVIERCKKVFMEQCYCIRYVGDEPGCEYFPTVRLGKVI